MTLALFAAPLFLLAAPGAAQPEAPPAVAASPSAEARTASNVVFGEALGNGLLYSVNYERIFDALPIGLRAGASYFTYPVSSYGRSGNLKLATFPLVASYYVGTPRHKLQLGLGATILYLGVSSDSTGTKFEGERSGFGVAGTAVIGYRYLPPERGFSFGVGFTPLLRTSSFLPWGGANAGYVF
ncbi:hypothetical protein BH11MYX4_BH11MYX4_66920 [soil metagenome]